MVKGKDVSVFPPYYLPSYHFHAWSVPFLFLACWPPLRPPSACHTHAMTAVTCVPDEHNVVSGPNPGWERIVDVAVCRSEARTSVRTRGWRVLTLVTTVEGEGCLHWSQLLRVKGAYTGHNSAHWGYTGVYCVRVSELQGEVKTREGGNIPLASVQPSWRLDVSWRSVWIFG